MVKSKKSKLPDGFPREGIQAVNPETFYTFAEEEIGKGKFSVVKKVTNKKTGKTYAAKIIKFDSESLMYATREYDVMMGDAIDPKKASLKTFKENESVNRSLPFVHEAFLVRKYLVLIMDLGGEKTLLEYFGEKHSITEEDVATWVKWICSLLKELHQNNIVHLDIRPTNMRMTSLNDMKLLDWNSARVIQNKKAGMVVDVIGDTEFCAPEMLSFDRVQPGSDIWSVAVIMYILLSGTSPYYYEDEARVTSSVEKVQYSLAIENFDNISPEAKDFIKKIFKRSPEMRMTATAALQHKWLSADYATKRKSSKIVQQDLIRKTDERLYSEEEEDYIDASLVFKTFEEEEHVSTEEEDSEEEED